MKGKQIKNISVELFIATLKLTTIGILIGYFHEYDFWIMIFLIVCMILRFYTKIVKNFTNNLVLFYGMIFTGIFGTSAEYWGVSNGYWSYHDLSNAREFPYWLFFAWMLAFYFLYKLECRLIGFMKTKTLGAKLFLTISISMIFPVLGEIITIYLGVWTYHLPIKFLGVPLYAILGLITIHMVVNLFMVFICKKYNIQDPIFSLNNLDTQRNTI